VTTARTPARAEVVGSLLRPPALRAAIEAVYEPGHHAMLAEEREKDLTALRRAEDDAIRDALRRQLELGLDVVSDGELRRYMFTNSFYDAVDGVATDNVVAFTNARGERVELAVHAVKRRLRKIASPAAREAEFLAGITDHPFKVTLPAASLFTHPFGVEPDAYESVEEFAAHAVAIERELIAEAVAAGCRYVQLDFALYPYLVDEAWTARFRAAGHSLDALLEGALAADRSVLEGLPVGVTTGLHLCRGNYRSSWLCAGSLDAVAERMFSELPYDVFLIEWDDVGRDGGYAPIRFVPAGRIVAMGLVSSKTRTVEAEDDVVRRLEDASRFAAVDQLAISTQCGFASVMEGNEIDEETQWRKLDLVARVADRVWPR
jgi:5-methyltetrahydropteroyltriglutamate--homocysteine methyltransferase